MNNQIDLRGASGAIYRYRLAENAEPKTPIGGNFAYLTMEGQVLFIGETNNLASGAQQMWAAALATYGAVQLFVRFNVSSATRRHEHDDLLAALQPVMNIAGE